ncbi:MAG TPA: Pvc16 family protein [Yinghuangia sp.]|nr:Pvc16 family protein [Yinghuangia sp.]
MIDTVDLTLRRLLMRVPNVREQQIGFQPPDEAWRQRVSTGTGLWVNCVLADLREDRRLRQNIRRRVTVGNVTLERGAPVRVRCHYLITVWNSAQNTAQVPATEQEHAVLGDILTALVDADPLVPSELLTPQQLARVPESLRDAALPTDVVPPEGFPKLAEFWGLSSRAVAAWRPALYLIVTVPVPEPERRIDGVVHTVLTTYGVGPQSSGGTGAAEPPEILADAGGIVLRTTATGGLPQPVSDAEIELADTAGQVVARAHSSGDGRFVIVGVAPGAYLARVTAPGLAPSPPSPVHIPGPSDAPIELRIT